MYWHIQLQDFKSVKSNLLQERGSASSVRCFTVVIYKNQMYDSLAMQVQSKVWTYRKLV